ncbi:putative amino acid permease [Aspergillus clavatus NRRL 1]|uniref:Amino acid permease, putative n=1 Tax=Aspergillus clavatus (strain ATCC 1007 / CBS 513.65 / DSM 816 / NCTC 3887 / NRRL 1 / QM 1276 / 107) TaxID=344612 RepID=A1C8X1_ASPCL|nr:amino acid permease, putative [Aspergillus clavatus NRRL 1]EAW13758.1 amino acid permease, putative [Aspergillus clavatus NRRL 1]
MEPETSKSAADTSLEGLGYTPELSRNRSVLQVAFMCFILSSVPYGLATTLFYPLAGGGPSNIIWGWIIVSIIILCVACSLAEITSVYPTAGGVYYQTFALSPPWCRRAAAWICGWSYVLGNVTITLAVNFGTTLFFVACLNVFESSPGVGLVDDLETYQIYLIFLAMTLLTHAISALGNKWLPHLETFAIFCTLIGLIAMIVCTLVIAKHGRHSGKWVFTHFEPQSGWPSGWSFCIGLLHAAYATSATGMIISMCEEVQEPATQVPRAMVATIVLNFVAGLAFLLPLTFVLPDLTMLVNLVSAQPTPVILKDAIGNSAGAFCLLLPLIILGIICGVGCVTAASRCTWAFARDGGIPGSKWWKSVNRSLDIPLNAMMLDMGVEIALGAIYFGSTAAFNAFSGVGVIFLTLSYACPIAVSFLFRRRADLKNARFQLGFFGGICNVVALAWSLLAIPLFCMPSFMVVTLETMSYACVVFVGFTAIAALWYWVWGYQNYAGPPKEGVDAIAEYPNVHAKTG